MKTLGRRTFLGGVAGLAAVGAASAWAAPSSARVVVVGGGFGGASAARFIKHLAPAASVILVEANATYVACPYSNLVVAGERPLAAQQFTYSSLGRTGIEVRRARATDVDPAARTVTLSGGERLRYDRLVLAPGVDFRWDALPGYGPDAAERMPHAWKAGPQTLQLSRQLQAMPDGGVAVITVPAAPFRCPPGPYERASLIAHYLSVHKPRSKLLILDANDRFSKQPLFEAAWAAHYGSLLERRDLQNDGRVVRVHPEEGAVETDFERIEAQVVNVIPPQKAGEIAQRAAVVDATGWCPIDATSFVSTIQPGIHVIGDAAIAAPMPKSAFAANAQAKVCAIQVVRALSDREPLPTVLANTCYSFVTPETAISIAGVYDTSDGSFAEVPDSGGISDWEAGPAARSREAAEADAWFATITRETFG